MVTEVEPVLFPITALIPTLFKLGVSPLLISVTLGDDPKLLIVSRTVRKAVRKTPTLLTLPLSVNVTEQLIYLPTTPLKSVLSPPLESPPELPIFLTIRLGVRIIVVVYMGLVSGLCFVLLIL